MTDPERTIDVKGQLFMPQERAMQSFRAKVIALVAIAALVGLMAWVSLVLDDLRRDRAVQVVATYDTMSALSRLFTAVMEGETSQRGFLLTGRSDFLVPFESARRGIDTAAADLNTKVIDPKELTDLKRLIAHKTRELDTTVRLGRQGKIGQALNLVHGGTGEAWMNKIRGEVERLSALERSRRDQAESARQRYADWNRIFHSVAFMSVGVLLFLLAFFIRRDVRRIDDQHRKIEE